MKNQKNNNKRKIAIGVLAGLAITGLVGASAATLGGISGQGLGADADVVASCDTDGVTVAYDTSYAGAEAVHVDQITIGAVNLLCDTLDYEVQLYDGSDVVLGEATGAVALVTVASPAADDFVVDFTAAAVDAELVEGIAITISGNG